MRPDKGIFIIYGTNYIDIILKRIGLENANDSILARVKDSALLRCEVATTDRSCVDKDLCLNNDGGEGDTAAPDMTTDMKIQSKLSMLKLVSHAWYLEQTRDGEMWIQANDQIEDLTMFTNGDPSQCKKTRRATASGVLMLWTRLLVCYSFGRQIVCISSGEV